MGTSYYGHAIIGIAIDIPSDLPLPEVVPSCHHPERIGNVFCPKCGTRVDDKTTYSRKDYWMVREEIDGHLPHDYVVAQDGYDEDGHMIVGYGVRVSYDGTNEKRLPLPDLEEVRATIKSALAEVGLSDIYDEADFGLHGFATAS